MPIRIPSGPARAGGFFMAALIAFSAVRAASGTDEPSLPELIRKLQAVYDDAADWMADFSQSTRIAGFEAAVTARGKMYIKKPGRMRWDYLEPNRNQVLVNDGKLWLHTPEQQQVIVSPFSSVSDSQLPLHFLTGVGRLDREFTVAWEDPAHPAPDGSPVIALTPREPGSGLSRLEITVDPAGHYITRMALLETNGNRSVLDFSNVKINTGLKDRFFAWTPPKGTVVIEAPVLNP